MDDELIESPLQSIYTAAEPPELTSMYVQNTEMINEALRSIGSLPKEKPVVPDYFDSMLKQLIDAIPLE